MTLLGMILAFPWSTSSVGQPFIEPLPKPKTIAYARVEVPETSLGYGNVEMTDGETCRVAGKDGQNRDVSYTYASNTAVCALDVLSKADHFSYTLRFYSPWSALLTSLTKDGVTYNSSIWFAINNDLSPSENCDDLIGVSLTSCTLNHDDELLIFYDESSFYPVLRVEEMQGQTYVTTEDATFTIREAVSHEAVSSATLICGNSRSTANDVGKVVIRIPEEGVTECFAEKSEYLRSRRIEITVLKGEDDDPPNNEEPDDTPDDPPSDTPGDSENPPADNPQSPSPDPSNPGNNNPGNSAPPSDPQTPGGNSPANETPNGNAPQENPTAKKISFEVRQKAALQALKYLSRLQNEDGLIVDELLSSWASMAFSAYGRPPYDVHHGGPSLDQALWYVDATGMDSLTLSRHILGLAASGHDLTAVNSANLCAELKKGWNGKMFGDAKLLNDDIFGLLAARACKDAGLTNLLRTTVIQGQNTDGGYGITFKGKSNVDITSAAIQALADAGTSLQAPRDYLKTQQNTDAGFPYQKGAFSNTASTAWAIAAIVSLGEDPHAWNKAEESPWSYLLKNQTASGAFIWTSGETADVLMTTYAVTGLLGKPWPIIGVFSEKPDYFKQKTVEENSNKKTDIASQAVVKDERDQPLAKEVSKQEETFFGEGIISSVSAEDRYQVPARVLGASASKNRDALDIVLLVALAVVLESLVFWTRRAISVR